MDPAKLIQLLKATTDPALQENAQVQLKQIEKIIGVGPALLRIVMSNDVELPVRQAGIIYLKNMIAFSWSEPEEDEPARFHIHEQDRAIIRDSLVDAAVHSPTVIRNQICVCINMICRKDFPGRWTSLVDKLCVYLQSPEVAGWPGALCALLSVVKVFEYKKGTERTPLDEAMNLLLPLVQQIISGLINDLSQPSLMMQRLILKTFHALTQHHLPLHLMGDKGQWLRFQGWMEVVRQVLDRSNPEMEKKPDDDDREELERNEWWKTKKWAMRILYRMFERYGSPGGVTKEYKDFSAYFLNNYSQGALQVVFKVLDAYRRQAFVAEKVLRNAILYLKNAVSHAHTWKLMKQHADAMVSDVIYPLLCHSDEDERLWKEDPVEYIHLKYGEYASEEDSAVSCGENLLNAMCKKRKGVLPKCLQLVTTVLNDPNSSPRQKDGALHMVGSVANILLKKDDYKDQFDDVLIRFVFPCMSAQFAFLRARAAWLLSKLSTVKFSRDEILQETIRVLVGAILNKEEELPVKVEAAFAVFNFISDQHRCHPIFQPHVGPVCVELLHILRATENDDLTSVLQKIVCSFVPEVTPLAIEICAHLASTFSQVMESTGNDGEEKTIVAMGLLNTMETVLVVMDEQPEICIKLEPILLQVVSLILENTIMEFYEEAFSIVASLTEKQISPQMWQVYEAIYRCFERDGTEYFVEMMPALHSYITVDPDAFLSDPNRLLAMCTIIKKVMDKDSDADEDAETHAAKLIEVLILTCREKIQNAIPNLLQLVIERLSREVKTTELRTMCLQVVVAALYHDLNLTLSVITSMDAFVEQWISDIDCFLGLHDRRVCVLGLCTLLQSQVRPQALQKFSDKILPSLIVLFDGLKRAYAAKALENAETDSEDENDDDEDCDVEEVLSSDEDEIDEDGAEYLEALERKIKGAKAPFDISTDITEEEDDSDDDSYDDGDSVGETTALESFETPLDNDDCLIDEYVIFKEVMQNLQAQDPQWYHMLTTSLNEEQGKSVQEIFTLADQRKAAAQSKEILKRGGYEFSQQNVPTSFNFGNGVPNTLKGLD